MTQKVKINKDENNLNLYFQVTGPYGELTPNGVEKMRFTIGLLIKSLKKILKKDKDRGCLGNTARFGLGQMCMPINII